MMKLRLGTESSFFSKRKRKCFGKLKRPRVELRKYLKLRKDTRKSSLKDSNTSSNETTKRKSSEIRIDT